MRSAEALLTSDATSGKITCEKSLPDVVIALRNADEYKFVASPRIDPAAPTRNVSHRGTSIRMPVPGNWFLESLGELEDLIEPLDASWT
jgi:hypothetical protein